MMAPPVDPGGMMFPFSYQSSPITAFISTRNRRWVFRGSSKEITPSFTTFGAMAASGNDFKKFLLSILVTMHFHPAKRDRIIPSNVSHSRLELVDPGVEFTHDHIEPGRE